METSEIVNLVESDWTEHNQQVLRHCKLQAEEFVNSQMEEYPDTEHRSSVRGNMLWDQMDRFLEEACQNHLLENITPQWIVYGGAKILTLRGKHTSLTAKHVLSREEELPDSENSYRTNNKVKNQSTKELFKEFDSLTEEGEEPIHIVLQHGGKGGLFAYLKAYFTDTPTLTLTEDMMLLEDLDTAVEAEFVSEPSVTLKAPVITGEPTPVPTPETTDVLEDDDSQS